MLTEITLASLDTAFEGIGPTGAVRINGHHLVSRKHENADWWFAGSISEKDFEGEIIREIERRFEELAK